jgi:hypothetical protein
MLMLLGLLLAAPASAQGLSGASPLALSGSAAAAALSLPWNACKRAGTPPSTGASTETALVSCLIPANTLGPDGCVEIKSDWSAVANGVQPILRFGNVAGVAGSTYMAGAVVSGSEYRDPGRLLCNVGSVSAQQGFAGPPNLFSRVLPGSTSTVATTSDRFVNFDGLSNPGGTLVLNDYLVTVYRSAGR